MKEQCMEYFMNICKVTVKYHEKIVRTRNKYETEEAIYKKRNPKNNNGIKVS